MNKCDSCVYFDYDPESESYICLMDLDQDDMERFLMLRTRDCPYYKYGDDYTLARKQ